jgi:[ribosomal protein S18]-alanine N-acetyltransferase
MSVQIPRIRYSRPEDLGYMHEIDQICFPAHISFSRAELLFYLNHPKSIARVAEGLGRILGFVMVKVERDKQAHVITLDVIPDARQQNVGTMLMNEIHRELKRNGVRSIILEVGADNIPAQRLYEGLQYRYIARLSGYYHGREDAYQMARKI